MSKSKPLLLVICLLCAIGAAAEPAIVVAELEIQVEGITREFLLRDKSGIEVGSRFADRAALDGFLKERTQVLLNERVLETVEIRVEEIPGSGDLEARPVKILLAVRDSWNLIALPYFRYDSNSGLLLSVRGRDYNFLGSMQTLTLNLDFRLDEKNRAWFGLSSGFSIPWATGDFRFELGVDEELQIYPDGSPTSNVASLRLGTTYLGWALPVSWYLSQGLTVNPDGDPSDPDSLFLSSALGGSLGIPLADDLLGLGEAGLSLSVSSSLRWKPAGLVLEERRGFETSLRLGASWGRVDWVGNAKRGAAVEASATATHYERLSAVYIDADASLRIYAPILGPISGKARLSARSRLLGAPPEDLGGAMRGILDARVDGAAAVFLNLDLPAKLFDFPTHVILGVDWFDFELQAGPFLDLGVAAGQAPWASGGLEVAVFPKRMRSFIVRGSLGFDLMHLAAGGSPTGRTDDDSSPYEIFFGLGLHY